jgi:hypothetical protein
MLLCGCFYSLLSVTTWKAVRVSLAVVVDLPEERTGQMMSNGFSDILGEAKSIWRGAAPWDSAWAHRVAAQAPVPDSTHK